MTEEEPEYQKNEDIQQSTMWSQWRHLSFMF